MREIMFRGKRIDNGKWVEGYLYITHTGTCEIGCYNAETNIERWTSDVDPATVGQYTGLKDKNGKRIFDGDIVRIQSKNYKVKYLLGQFFAGMNMPIAYKRFECDVVGNVYDNPEMLKGGEE